jgi:hypothetical protein
MSFVYPIAPGSAPVFVLVVSVVALGARISALGVVGVLLIAVGIVLVRGLTNSGRPRDLALALAVGGCIASYTLVDKHGIVHSRADHLLGTRALRDRGGLSHSHLALPRRSRTASGDNVADARRGGGPLRIVCPHARRSEPRAGGIGSHGARDQRRNRRCCAGGQWTRATTDRAYHRKRRGRGRHSVYRVRLTRGVERSSERRPAISLWGVNMGPTGRQ